jgi:hypothetical protein
MRAGAGFIGSAESQHDPPARRGKPVAPAADLFMPDAPLRLVVRACRRPGGSSFPTPAPTISRPWRSPTGTLWSYTIQRFRQDAAYAGPEEFTPWALGYVDLPGEVIVQARLVNVAFADIRIGMPLALTRGAGRAPTIRCGCRPLPRWSGQRERGGLHRRHGIHPFGRTPGLSGLEQGVHAVRAALGDAGVDWADIQFAYGGSDAAGNPDSMVSHLGLTGVQFINVRNGCATGGSALFSAQMAIRSGEFELGLALGFDKHPRGAFNALPAEYNLPEWYGAAGYMVTTQFFAAKIMRYMHLHGISRRTLGLVAEKAFANGVHAPTPGGASPSRSTPFSMRRWSPTRSPSSCSARRAKARWRWCWRASARRANWASRRSALPPRPCAPARRAASRSLPRASRPAAARRRPHAWLRPPRSRLPGSARRYRRGAVAGHRSGRGDHAHGRKRLLRRWRSGSLAGR